MNELFCPSCGGDTFVPLGQLGRLFHLRCRECGADSHVAAEDLPDELESDPVDEAEEVLACINRHPAAQR